VAAHELAHEHLILAPQPSQRWEFELPFYRDAAAPKTNTSDHERAVARQVGQIVPFAHT
jgi:hypothetical protein